MDFPLSSIDRLQHVALSRLSLYITGRIHAAVWRFEEPFLAAIRNSADSEGNVQVGQLPNPENGYGKMISDVASLIHRGRLQAADIAFTPWLLQHNAHFPETLEMPQRLQERWLRPQALKEARVANAEEIRQVAEMWTRRRNRALSQAAERTMGDGLRLSTRIWRMENEGMRRIRGELASAMTDRTSAWDLAHRMERLLGADAQMPRWTEQRLLGMTPTQRMRDLSGLLRGPNEGLPGSQGVAYNSLRLARTELQYANHAMTSDIAQNCPWITGRFTRLSPGHPKSDVCDAYAAGGPYPTRDEILPLHPQCMCFYEEAMMSRGAFVAEVKGWLEGDNQFLDGYRDWLGMNSIGPLPTTVGLADALEMWMTMRTWADNDVDAMAQVIEL